MLKKILFPFGIGSSRVRHRTKKQTTKVNLPETKTKYCNLPANLKLSIAKKLNDKNRKSYIQAIHGPNLTKKLNYKYVFMSIKNGNNYFHLLLEQEIKHFHLFFLQNMEYLF